MKRTSKRPARRPTSLERALKKQGIVIRQISEEEAKRNQLRRKQKLGLYDWPELGKLNFPGYFTVVFNYFATGEGTTHGVTMCSAASAKDLREIADGDFGDYYASGAEIRAGLEPPPGNESLVPARVKAVVAKITSGKKRPCNFHFTARLHVNYS